LKLQNEKKKNNNKNPTRMILLYKFIGGDIKGSCNQFLGLQLSYLFLEVRGAWERVWWWVGGLDITLRDHVLQSGWRGISYNKNTGA